jgi:hypothetical protein
MAAAAQTASVPPVVTNGQLDSIREVGDDDLCARMTGVLDHVGQAFLQNPVCGRVDAGRERPLAATDVESYRHSGGLHVGDQALDQAEAGPWVDAITTVGIAHQAEHAPHLAERLAAGALDRLDGLTSRDRVGVEHPGRGLCLHDDEPPMLWAAASWSSRAIRRRSSATAARAMRSFSSARRAASAANCRVFS